MGILKYYGILFFIVSLAGHVIEMVTEHRIEDRSIALLSILAEIPIYIYLLFS